MQKERNTPFYLSIIFLGINCIMPLLSASNGKKNIKLSLIFEQYEHAKQMYQSGHYSEAKLLFSALKSKEEVLSLMPYFCFYYALSCHYNQEEALAKQSFFDLLSRFPCWNKCDEVRYWSAQFKFKDQQPVEALTLIASIKDKGLVQPVLSMKKYFLKKIENIQILEELLDKFPTDSVIKKILSKKAVYSAYLTQDDGLIDRLKANYNCFIHVYDPLARLTSTQKEVYSVAILLPFFMDELDYEDCKDQFVIELYQGIKLALEVLKKQGIAIRLFTFDTKKDPVVTAALLAQKEMKHMDLIIGPLYPDTIPLVAEFSKRYKINFVNPISTNSAIIKGNPFAFLFQPMLETYAQKAAELTLRHIHEHSLEDPVVAVFYGDTKEEISQAERYKEIMEQSLGKPLDIFVKLSSRVEIEEFFSNLNQIESQEKKLETTEEEVQLPGIDLKRITHIYLPTQNDLLIATVVGFPFKFGISPQIIGHEQWIRKDLLTLYHLQKLPLLLLAPNYIDFNKPGLLEFRENFFKQTASLPTMQSYIGYEMMLFFGQMLGRYGNYFQKSWENMHYSGAIFQGVYYGKSHSNQHILVLKFVKDKFLIE